jgi:hypothetical protein
VTALQRLPKQSKLVSEPHLSLIDRPGPPEGRCKNIVQSQLLVDFDRASFSKVQPIAKKRFEPAGRAQGGRLYEINQCGLASFSFSARI